MPSVFFVRYPSSFLLSPFLSRRSFPPSPVGPSLPLPSVLPSLSCRSFPPFPIGPSLPLLSVLPFLSRRSSLPSVLIPFYGRVVCRVTVWLPGILSPHRPIAITYHHVLRVTIWLPVSSSLSSTSISLSLPFSPFFCLCVLRVTIWLPVLYGRVVLFFFGLSLVVRVTIWLPTIYGVLS